MMLMMLSMTMMLVMTLMMMLMVVRVMMVNPNVPKKGVRTAGLRRLRRCAWAFVGIDSGRSVDAAVDAQWTLSFYEVFAIRRKTEETIIFFFFLTKRKKLVKTERPLSVHCSVH